LHSGEGNRPRPWYIGIEQKMMSTAPAIVNNGLFNQRYSAWRGCWRDFAFFFFYYFYYPEPGARGHRRLPR